MGVLWLEFGVCLIVFYECLIYSTVAMEHDKAKYAVIEFIYDDLQYVSACPTNWLVYNDNQIICRWPPSKSNERKAIEKSFIPQVDWLEIDNIKVQGRYATFKEAAFKEKKLSRSDASDDSIRSKEYEEKKKRKIRKPPKYREGLDSPLPSFKDLSSSDLDESDENDVTIVATIQDTPDGEKIIPAQSNYEKDQNQIVTVVATIHDPPYEGKIIPAQRNNKKGHNQISGIRDTSNWQEIPPVSDIDTTLSDTDGGSEMSNKTLDRIEMMLIDLKESIKMILQRVGQMEEQLNNNVRLTKESVLPKLPLDEVLEIQNLEDLLQSNEYAKSELINLTRFLGGNDVNKSVTRVMTGIFSNHVGQFCSWTGKKGNFQLEHLQVMKVIKEALRLSVPGMTDPLFQKETMNWFQHAKTRYLRKGQYGNDTANVLKK